MRPKWISSAGASALALWVLTVAGLALLLHPALLTLTALAAIGATMLYFAGCIWWSTRKREKSGRLKGPCGLTAHGFRRDRLGGACLQKGERVWRNGE